MTWLSQNKLTTIQATQPVIVERIASNLPQTTQTAYFTVSGKALLVNIVGEVTTIIEAQATNIKLVANPTVGADVDLCAAVDINGDAVGTMYNITGTLADTMVATTSGTMQSQVAGVVVSAGSIDLDADESSTGQTKWVLHYVPLEDGASITTA